MPSRLLKCLDQLFAQTDVDAHQFELLVLELFHLLEQSRLKLGLDCFGDMGSQFLLDLRLLLLGGLDASQNVAHISCVEWGIIRCSLLPEKRRHLLFFNPIDH